MKYKEIANRLTGFSTPIFGVSWNPEKLDCDIAQRVINELEDRRVLYNPSEMEVPHYCVESVIQIRRLLTSLLHDLDSQSNLAANIKAMRSACRKFLDTVQADECIVKCGADFGHFASWQFNGAVGELRGVMGIHLAQMATQYGINIEEPLSTILPLAADTDET